MHQTTSTAAIILAAGSSSRMKNGQHKLLLPLDGRPVLTHVLDATLASQARPIILVLGHNAAHIRTQLTPYQKSPAITIVENTSYLQGMSTSMHIGLATLQDIISYGYKKLNIDSAIILLGDQPLITANVIDMLIAARQESNKSIIAPLYNGKRGNPVLFASSLFPELMEVVGDEGGRSVVEQHKQELATVEVSDITANYDMDTWEAYQEVLEMWQRQKNQHTEQQETDQ
jgi:molybdenum cofactor cytidylyltransferase